MAHAVVIPQNLEPCKKGFFLANFSRPVNKSTEKEFERWGSTKKSRRDSDWFFYVLKDEKN
jgi:hypothetical protein